MFLSRKKLRTKEFIRFSPGKNYVQRSSYVSLRDKTAYKAVHIFSRPDFSTTVTKEFIQAYLPAEASHDEASEDADDDDGDRGQMMMGTMAAADYY